MTINLVVAPVYRINCDTPGCSAWFVPERDIDQGVITGARLAAYRAGWQVRPTAGPGARTMPDHCPAHKAAGFELHYGRLAEGAPR